MSQLEYEPVYCQLLGQEQVEGENARREISVWEGWCNQDKMGNYRPLDPGGFPDLFGHSWVGAFRWRRMPRNLWPAAMPPTFA
jgi:hypothetical protein